MLINSRYRTDYKSVKGKHGAQLCKERNCWHRYACYVKKYKQKNGVLTQIASRLPARTRRRNQFIYFRRASSKIILKKYVCRKDFHVQQQVWDQKTYLPISTAYLTYPLFHNYFFSLLDIHNILTFTVYPTYII